MTKQVLRSIDIIVSLQIDLRPLALRFAADYF